MAETDDDQIEQLRRLWDRYGVPVLIAGAVVAVVVLGGRYWQARALDRAAQASAQYEKVLAAADLSAAEAAVKALRDAHGGSNYTVLADLHLAGLATQAGQLETAQAALRDALDRADNDADRHVARIRLARVLLDLDRAPDAAALLTDAPAQGPFAADYAELRGDAARARGDHDAARTAWREALALSGQDGRGALLKLKLDDLGS